jgi:TonB family protein
MFALLVLATRPLAGQERAGPAAKAFPTPPVCDALTLIPTGTLRARIVLVPRADTKTNRAQAQLALGVARLLAASLAPPSELPLRGWTGTWFIGSATTIAEPRPDSLYTSLVSATLEIVVDTAGRLDRVKVLRRSAAPALEAALLLAAQRADSLGAFGALPTAGKKARVIQLSMGTTIPGDTLGVEIVRLRLPFRPLTRSVQVHHIPAPAYPAAGLAHRIEERVELQYVVGADGRVVPGSVRLVNEPYQEFVDAARDAIVRGEFEPARIGGCAAAQLVGQVIRFRTR